MALRYTRFRNEDGSENLTVLVDGELYAATDQHPNWESILERVDANDTSVVDLFDAGKTIAKRFEQLSERVTVKNGRIYFDGDEVKSGLTKQIIRFLDEGLEDWKPLVRFMDRVSQNTSENSREQLYTWLEAHDFSITDDGKFIAYKGVANRDGEYFSITHGKAIVDGEEHNGSIPNHVGAVITMPRSEVEDNSGVGCSTGLHAGTWKYASEFARGAVLKVLIDPRDVVSVPSDCAAQKIRTCRYTVLEVIDAPNTSAYDQTYSVSYSGVDTYGDEAYDDFDGEEYDSDREEWRYDQWGL